MDSNSRPRAQELVDTLQDSKQRLIWQPRLFRFFADQGERQRKAFCPLARYYIPSAARSPCLECIVRWMARHIWWLQLCCLATHSTWIWQHLSVPAPGIGEALPYLHTFLICNTACVNFRGTFKLAIIIVSDLYGNPRMSQQWRSRSTWWGDHSHCSKEIIVNVEIPPTEPVERASRGHGQHPRVTTRMSTFESLQSSQPIPTECYPPT